MNRTMGRPKAGRHLYRLNSAITRIISVAFHRNHKRALLYQRQRSLRQLPAGQTPSGSINGRELLDQLSDYQLLKHDCAPWSNFISSYLYVTSVSSVV
jgi:hypothetical protein